MKVALLVRALPAHRMGGLELHTRDLAVALDARGHEVHVFTTPLPIQPGPDLLAQSIRVHTLPRARPADYSILFWQGLRRLVEAEERSGNFDVIHAQEFAGLYWRRFDEPFVCTVHGTMFSETLLDRRYFARLSPAEKLGAIWRFKARVALQPAFRGMLARSDQIIVDSIFTRQELLRISPFLQDRIREVPLGLDQSRYDLRPARKNDPARRLTIVLLGRIQEMKGLRIAAEAARVLHERRVRVEFVIGGRGVYERELRSLIARWGMQDLVRFAGYVPPDQLSSFLRSGDVFLFPDLTHPAFGLVAVEAMLHGLPVIGAYSGAIPEVVTPENGWLYEPWNVDELVGTIESIVKDPDVLARKSVAAQETAHRYTASKMAEQVEAVYREVI